MIRPKIVPLTPDLYPGISTLVTESGCAYATDYTYPSDLALVALHKDRVVGLITAWADQRPYAWLDAMIVMPDVRGEGIAYFMYKAMRKLLKERGIKKLWAFTTYDGWVKKADRLGLKPIAEVTLLEGEL